MWHEEVKTDGAQFKAGKRKYGTAVNHKGIEKGDGEKEEMQRT